MTRPETQGVDVLAVMDSLIDVAFGPQDHGTSFRIGRDHPANQARAAIAELIEAATQFLHASYLPEFDGCPDEVKQEYRYRHRLLRAALAAVTPQEPQS